MKMQSGGIFLNQFQSERYELAKERITAIEAELTGGDTIAPQFSAFFLSCAKWLVLLLQEREYIESGAQAAAGIEELQVHNHLLYEEILPEHYGCSYANPAYAANQLGEEYGPLCAALFYELRSALPFVYEGAEERVLPRLELFLEIYGAFAEQYDEYKKQCEERESCAEKKCMEDSEAGSVSDASGVSGAENQTAYMIPQYPPYRFIKGKIYSYLSDYAEEESAYEIGQKLAGENDFAGGVLGQWQEDDLRYLYYFGEYIGENELGAARHLLSLPQQTVDRMADTYTEGYRIGFIVTGKDLSAKKRVGVIWRLGFERMVKKAAANFAVQGLSCTYFREVPTLFRMLRSGKSGYAGGDANPQYLYDHREDLALFLDDTLVNRRLEALENVYQEKKAQTVLFAGPAVIETFGEKPFSPVNTSARPAFNNVQQKWIAGWQTKASLLYNEAVIGKNRSFTIIAFPVPEIAAEGGNFGEIFDAVVEINTLDYEKYRRIQATLIDALDQARTVRVRGQKGNRTDMTVVLYQLTDPEHQTIFENCVADVNIPVGEVFTSPVLEGTKGTLHVSEVFLNGLQFRDLELTFEEGRVVDYRCGNFEDPSQGRRYIEDNILFHHDRLPIGEFAIGTNTTAYAAARKYHIADRLPILIAEKTGPHFAVGDTCYSYEEDNKQYNPDGKEIVAKENSVSRLRLTNPGKAYFGCHTDITIPYEELGEVTAVCADGREIPLIREGRFVLPGTEELNEALGD